MESVNNVQYKQRAVTLFLGAEKESVINIHKRRREFACLWKCYGRRNTVGRWAKSVTAPETAQADLPRSGCPAIAVGPEMLQPTYAFVREDQRITAQ
jgi:hypothetical protein